MSTTVCVSNYEYQGQVYSPAFSEPSSPAMSTTSESTPPTSPCAKRNLISDEDSEDLEDEDLDTVNNVKKAKRFNQDDSSLDQYRSRVPRFANKYEAMLQPLRPVTTLMSRVRRPLPSRTHKSEVDIKLQNQFHNLIAVATLDEIEDFLAKHTRSTGKCCLDVNQFNGDGRTALQQSCLEGNLPLAKVLVKYGANVQLTTRDGFSPLHLAVYSGHSNLMANIMSLR
jgi:hypothetical protein